MWLKILDISHIIRCFPGLNSLCICERNNILIDEDDMRSLNSMGHLLGTGNHVRALCSCPGREGLLFVLFCREGETEVWRSKAICLVTKLVTGDGWGWNLNGQAPEP